MRHHHQQRDGAAGAQQVIERLQAGGVDPLHIIQQQHQRRAPVAKVFTSASTIWLKRARASMEKVSAEKRGLFSRSKFSSGTGLTASSSKPSSARDRRIFHVATSRLAARAGAA